MAQSGIELMPTRVLFQAILGLQCFNSWTPVPQDYGVVSINFGTNSTPTDQFAAVVVWTCSVPHHFSLPSFSGHLVSNMQRVWMLHTNSAYVAKNTKTDSENVILLRNMVHTCSQQTHAKPMPMSVLLAGVYR